MEGDVCAGILLSVVARCRARQVQQDTQIESRRRLRRQLLLSARRLRLRRLRQTWERRSERHRQCRLHRLCAHDVWMKTITHTFLKTHMRRRAKVWFYPRNSAWWEETAAAFTDDQWLQHFRVSRETFSYLCRTLRPRLKRQDTTYRLCIPLQKRVGLALYKLANSCDYKTLSNLFAVGVASVCRCVHEFCTAVIEVLKPQLVVTPNHADLAAMADHFYQTYGIPQCIGVIDSIHIPVIRPPHYQSDQPNEAFYLAILLQAVVDGKGLFWDLNMSCPKWVNDCSGSGQSWVSDHFPSRMHQICGTGIGHFILGDVKYPSQNWLVKPYPNTGWLTPEQELFNTQISQARCVADQAFGRLKGRWTCLSKRNDCNVEAVKHMIETCCVLHNLCEKNMDVSLPEWTADSQLYPTNGRPPKHGDPDTSFMVQQVMTENVQ